MINILLSGDCRRTEYQQTDYITDFGGKSWNEENMWENAEQRKFCELMQQTKENNE
jgi:hypothetical protein